MNRVRNIPRQNVVYRHGEIPDVRASCYRQSSSNTHLACTCPYQTRVRTGICYCVYDAAEWWLTPWMGSFTYAIRVMTARASLIFPFSSGGPYEGVPFRPTILDAVRDLGEQPPDCNFPYLTLPLLLIDSVARALLPSLPPLKPQTRLLTHLRSLLIFVPVGPASNALRTLDSIYTLTKYTEGSRELTEEEFAAGIEAARLLREVFERELEVLERGSTRSSQSGIGASDLREGQEERELRRPSGSHVQVLGYAQEGSLSGVSSDIAPI